MNLHPAEGSAVHINRIGYLWSAFNPQHIFDNPLHAQGCGKRLDFQKLGFLVLKGGDVDQGGHEASYHTGTGK